MKLYSAPYAPNPRRVTAFIAEKGITDIEIITLNLVEGEHRTPSFRENSPFAQVPTLILDDGRALTESRAICTFLEGVYPEPNMMGRDAYERGFFEMWDRRVELMISMPLMLWVRHGNPVLAALERNQSAEMAEINRAQAMKMAAHLDKHLSENTFVCGERISIADVTLLAGMDMAKMMKWRPGEDLPHLRRWRVMMAERPSGKTAP